MAKKHFEVKDQEHFAKVSRDRNPLHLDALIARRTQMGALVVHGMHTVLWCLDRFAQVSEKLPFVTSIAVNFMKPVYVGDVVDLVVARSSPLRLVAEVEGVQVMTLDLMSGPQCEEPWGDFSREEYGWKPKEKSFDEIERGVGTGGVTPVFAEPSELFTDVARWIGSKRVGALSALSTLVGMECPGLHSIFAGFNVTFTSEGPTQYLNYSILSTDDRFRRVKLNVQGSGIQGTIDAVVRIPPVVQLSVREIADQVKPGIFSGHRVLLIGGSRGIGEYTAKVIAAGGGQVTLTYRVGLVEAKSLADELKAFGALVDILPYDVCLPAAAQLEKLQAPTHVYYFATGRIFGHYSLSYNEMLYREFYQFYVKGFDDLCSAIERKTEKFTVFYPSSVAVTPENRPKGMDEYAMAKTEGEKLCAEMSRRFPGVRVMVKRLPRLLTDQTATTMLVSKEASMHSLLPIIFEVQGVAQQA